MKFKKKGEGGEVFSFGFGYEGSAVLNLKTQSKVGILLKEKGVEKGAGGLFILGRPLFRLTKGKSQQRRGGSLLQFLFCLSKIRDIGAEKKNCFKKRGKES